MNSKKFDVIIIGAGLSGLSVNRFLDKMSPDLDILVLEKSNRPGGAIRSMKKEGFLAEWGPHGFLDNVEENRELLGDLKIMDSAQKAPLKKFLRYICLGGKLITIPQTPPKIIRSNLMPFHSKMRVLGDLFLKPKPNEQTIADWAAYRFGKAMIPFADIAMTGTYAGDIDKLSIDAAMPGLRRLEKEFGSVFKGAIKSRKQKPNRSMPSMISFEDGMEHLVRKLAEGRNIRYKSSVDSIKRNETDWQVETGSGLYSAKSLVVALHINQALQLLKGIKKAPGPELPTATVINVVLGFDSSAEIPFGFGYLAPKSEQRFALGTLFSIHMFPKRAPDGLNLVEVLVGGNRNPERLELDDSELIDKAYRDISQLIKLPKPPVFSSVIRPKVGIPQLEMGYGKYLDYRESLHEEAEGLHICGFGWEGIGINEMVRQARKTAVDVLNRKASGSGPARAKPIYF